MNAWSGRLRRLGITVLGSLAAVGFALLVSAVVLQLSGHNAWQAFKSMYEYGKTTSSLISITNRAVPYFIAGLAVAIGFKMNLFNIGVEGQYRLAAVVAAWAGAAVKLPAPIHVLFIILVAAAVGASLAGIAGVLKVTRNVHEVITSIMLNTISTGLAAYLLAVYFAQTNKPGDLIIKTKEIPTSGWFPSLNRLVSGLGIKVPVGSNLQGFVLIAIVLGVGYWFLVWRTRFGYDLRASGVNPLAAQASGVDPNRMIITTMLLSGGIAGLAGLSQVLGFFHRYTIDFPSGIGFTGIGIALLGRNHPVGIALGSLLFAFLERSAQVLDLEGIPKEIVIIMQGVMILSIVIANEVVHRVVEVQERKAVVQATGEVPPSIEVGGVAA